MLITSLVLTAMLLLVANIVARKTGGFAIPCVICGLSTLLGWPLVIFPALMLTGAITALSGIPLRFLHARPALFLRYSLITAAISHLIVGIASYSVVRERSILRRSFPTESLAQRLSYEGRQGPAGLPGPVSGAGRMSLSDHRGIAGNTSMSFLEDRIEGLAWLRSQNLKRLHEDSVRDFIESPGFGIARQIGPHKEIIELPEADPIPLPPAAQQAKASAAISAFPESPADALQIVPEDEDLHTLHQDSILDFVNPKGFGFIKDREHVKGFQAHHFHAMPSLKAPRRRHSAGAFRAWSW